MIKRSLTILLSTIIFLLSNPSAVFSAEVSSPPASPAPTPFEAPEHPVDVLTPEMIAAPSAVLIDAKTGVAIFEKEKDEINYPASITKIMTALLVLENLPDMTARIKFSNESIFSLEPGSSHIAMNEDETLTVEQALYGLMLASANEVANAFAEEIAGGNENFSRLMTERAHELGALNTNFTNPHGLHDEKHYTTALDMALIMKECLKHPEFVKIINTVHYDIPPTEKQPEQRPLNNSHKMIFEINSNYDEDVVGGKTGFTSEAQHTLITFGKRGDMELIAVVLHDLASRTYADTRDMLNYGFTQFENVKIFDKDNFKRVVPIGSGTVEVKAEKSVEMYFPKSAVERVKEVDDLPDRLTDSVSRSDVIGTLKLLCDGNELAMVPLLAADSVKYETPGANESEQNSEQDSGKNPSKNSIETSGFEKLLNIILVVSGLLLLILILVLMYILFAKRRNKRVKSKRRVRRKSYEVKRAGEPRYRYRDDF